MQSLDETEEEIDTSALVYKSEDLSLIWELPVRNSGLCCHDFVLTNFLGYFGGSSLVR
jgi:hypothetical protein